MEKAQLIYNIRVLIDLYPDDSAEQNAVLAGFAAMNYRDVHCRLEMVGEGQKLQDAEKASPIRQDKSLAIVGSEPVLGKADRPSNREVTQVMVILERIARLYPQHSDKYRTIAILNAALLYCGSPEIFPDFQQYWNGSSGTK